MKKSFIFLLLFILSMPSSGVIGPFPSGSSGALSSIITANRAAVSNSTGAVTASATTSTEIGYLSGVTSPIQTQISGKIVGPGSSTDGDVATMNGTSGALVRDESKFNISSSTGAVTQTFTGAPTTLHSLDLSTATGWSKVYSLTGTIASTPTSMIWHNVTPTYTLSGSHSLYNQFISPTISGSTTDQALEKYSIWSTTASGTQWGVYNSAFTGLGGTLHATVNASTTGNAMGAAFLATGHNSIGLRGYAYGSTGTAGTRTSVGVIGTGGKSGGQASGGYFLVETDGSQTADENAVNPGFTAALVANAADGTSPSFIAENNGSSIFQVQSSSVVIGANGGTAVHEINGANVGGFVNTLTLVNGPSSVTSLNPGVYLKVKINGQNAVIPAWPVP